MTDRGAQLRALAEDHLAVIVLALVVVGLLGGYVTYGAYATTDTRTETQTASTWQSTGEFTHRATVVNGTDAFAEGEVLSDRSVYFRDDTPRLNGSFTYGYTADDGNLAANVSLVLVQRSIDESGDGNDTVLWRVERPRENITRSLAPGESANVSFSMNVSAVSERATTIDEQLGGTPGTVETTLQARIDLSGTRNGEQVDRTRVYSLPISAAQGVYRVQDPGPVTHSGEQTTRTQVPVSPGPLGSAGGPLLVVLSLAGLVGLAVGQVTVGLTVSETERARLVYQRQRKEYDEWITTGTVPSESLADPTVEVDSLEGLVDVAVDIDRRIIDDSDSAQFVVLGEEVNYIYTPPR